jgi:wee1-like protein kinase
VQTRKAAESSWTTNSRFSQDFEYLGHIGKGSFGDVLKVRHRLDGCLYAIKRLRKPIVGKQSILHSMKEVFALSVLSSPFITKYCNAWIEDSALHIQLEWCEGANLYSYVESRLPMNESLLLDVALQISQGLKHMHDHGVAHMDIKPENIIQTKVASSALTYSLVDSSYSHSDVQFKICDLGLCSRIESKSVDSVGDKRYLPHEALSLNIPHMDKVDMFSLGATLFELASGERLPDGGLGYYSLRNGDIKQLHNISAFSVELIRNLIHADPLKRPTAAAVIDAICDRQNPLQSHVTSLETEVCELRETIHHITYNQQSHHNLL